MGTHLMAAVAVTALALAACGSDDDDPSTEASGAGSPPTCEAFSLEDAEALLGLELHDRSVPQGTDTFCAYGDDTGSGAFPFVQWGAIVDPTGDDYESTRASVE